MMLSLTTGPATSAFKPAPTISPIPARASGASWPKRETRAPPAPRVQKDRRDQLEQPGPRAPPEPQAPREQPRRPAPPEPQDRRVQLDDSLSIGKGRGAARPHMR